MSQNQILIESAWEVCNQVGGIYTVLRSKVPVMVDKWGENYFLIGPYVNAQVSIEFEPIEPESDDPIGKVVNYLKEKGCEVHYGIWLITGRPKVILFGIEQVMPHLTKIRYEIWQNYGIPMPESSTLINEVTAFCYQVTLFYRALVELVPSQKVIAHFHEWMASIPLLDIKREKLPIPTVFTTHATQLGRYLAGNDTHFYENLPHYNWHNEAKKFGIECPAMIERYSALNATVFTTVSGITAQECQSFLGRKPEVITPNGLNIKRFAALHEFQNLHIEYKAKIHKFTMGHFFNAYKFDLENTLYFFTSGRYEYTNKGYDITLEALAQLNFLMKKYEVNKTVVMFFITKRPVHSVNPVVLEKRAMLDEIRQTCDAIQKQLGTRLFHEVASGTSPKLPALSDLIDDYWKLRLRRNVQAWKSKQLPIVVTHLLENDKSDSILNFIRQANLLNYPNDPVKIIYHPDFIVSSNPLFGLDYQQFVRGCNLGIFPSYYEPWGYTPLECLASGVPSVTSDLAGFGDYVKKNISNHNEKGLYVTRRQGRSFSESAKELADQLFSFVQMSLRERIHQRNMAENTSEEFDWKNLVKYYDHAYSMATKKFKNS